MEGIAWYMKFNLKNEKGIKLTSLVIYIVCLLIVTTIIGTYTKFFYNNIEYVAIEDVAEEEYAKFTAFLLNDINSENRDFIFSYDGNNSSYLHIKLKNGEIHQYIFQDKTIHFLKINNNTVEKNLLLCKNVTKNDVPFSYDSNLNKVTIKFRIQDKEFSNEYNLV